MSLPLVIMVGADKGGTGKTTVTRAVLDYLAAAKVACRAFDTESPLGGLKRFVPAAKVIDIGNVQHQMEVFDAVSGVTVLDVRAGMLSHLLATLDHAGVLDDVKAGTVGLVLLHVVGPSIQSLGELPAMAKTIGGGSKHYAVKNHVSPSTAYFEWDSADNQYAALWRDMEPITVHVPHLEAMACELTDKLGMSFADFASDGTQSRMLRGYVRAWLQGVHRELDKVGLRDVLPR